MSAMQMEEGQAGGPGPGEHEPGGRASTPGAEYASGRRGQGWMVPELDPIARRRKAPALAAILSLMPGLGQVYVGYYVRGFINVVVVASTITLLANGTPQNSMAPFFGLFLSFFWLYNMIDAWRIASLYNEALLAARSGEMKIDLPLPNAGGAMVGGIVLVALGLLLFLNTMFGMPLDWLREWWPLAPLGFGVYLITQAVKDRRRKGCRSPAGDCRACERASAPRGAPPGQ